MSNDVKEKEIVKQSAHFFLTRKDKIADCKLGEEVLVLADFAGVSAGTHGHIVEIYALGKKEQHTGVMVEWVEPNRPSWQKPLADGFSEDELEYLAFGTEKHPKTYGKGN